MALFSDILLTVDFDRTLTGPDSSIPKRNIEAIEYFMENGGAFTVNTGRSVPMSRVNLIPHVPVNAPLLLYNGSASYDTATGRLMRACPIELDADAVVQDIQARFPQLHLEIQGVDAHYLLRPDAGWEAYSDHNHCPWGYSLPSAVPGPFIKFSLYGQFREPTVASMYDATAQELAVFDEAVDYVQKTYGHKVDIFRACARIVDIHAKGCSKLRSARQLQQDLGRKILVCVGDAENDLTMLEGADYAYCPADGVIAGRFETVCPCGEGAIADVIYNKLPKIPDSALT